MKRTSSFRSSLEFRMGIKLIGITGKARSGKDTLAEALVEEHGFTRMAFADPLKLAAAAAFGWPVDKTMCDDQFKKFLCPIWGITVREALQRMGTEAMKGEFGEDFWVIRWAKDYAKIMNRCSVVVTDVRVDHEADVLRSEGAVIVHLSRPGEGLSGSAAAHSSERGIRFDPRHDLRIENNGTVEDLYDKAHALVAFIESHAAEYNLKNISAKG